MAEQGRFLTGSTMGHVVYMTSTGALGITFVFLVDAANLYWLSQLGDPRLVAAIGYVFAIQFLSVSSGIGMMIGATALVSRTIGEGDPEEARLQSGSALALTILMQGSVAIGFMCFRYPMLRLAGAEGETLELAADYLFYTLPSLVFMAVGMIGSAMLRAHGHGGRAMMVTLTAGAVSLAMDPMLIYLLALGLDGAAIGLNISRLVLLSVALWFAVRQFDLIARPALWSVRAHVLPFMAIAAPAIGTQLATPFGNYVLTSVIADFGDEAVAGWAVVSRLTVVVFGGIFALAGAIGGIFGQNYGARAFDRVAATYRDAILFCLIYTVIMWGILVVATDTVAAAFDLPPEGVEVLWAFTHVAAGAYVFTGFFFVANSAFNTLGRATRATWLTWLRDGILTWPVAVWFAGLAGAAGVIYAQAALAVVMGIIAAGWGWIYVGRLGRTEEPQIDLTVRQAARDPNRYRRR